MRAETEWKLRDLQREFAIVQLELVGLVARRAALRGPTPVGLVEYEQLLSALPSDARGESASLVAGAEDVVWCTLDTYESEDAYDPAALRSLWIEAFEEAGRDATVMASRGAVPELVITEDSGQSDLLGGAAILAYSPLINTADMRRGVRRMSASSGLDMVADVNVMRLDLIHEAVHAHDNAASPALMAATRSEDSDRARAAEIVAQAHAEFVTERLAETLDLSAVWRRRQRESLGFGRERLLPSGRDAVDARHEVEVEVAVVGAWS